MALDRILCTGDIADGIGSLERCCALLGRYGVETVRGNHDRWLLKGTMRELPDAFPSESLVYPERDYLRSLPTTREIDTVAGTLLLCHGMGDDDMTGLRPCDEGYALETNSELQRIVAQQRWPLVVAGHTHQRMVRKLANTHVINPGTLLPATGGQTFAVLDLESRVVRFLEFAGTKVGEVEVVALGS